MNEDFVCQIQGLFARCFIVDYCDVYEAPSKHYLSLYCTFAVLQGLHSGTLNTHQPRYNTSF
jgi:hypothetical protein